MPSGPHRIRKSLFRADSVPVLIFFLLASGLDLFAQNLALPARWRAAIIVGPAWWRNGVVEVSAIALLLLIGWAGTEYRYRKDRRDRGRLEAAVEARSAELAQANRELQEISLKDPLTGVRNRRFFQTTIAADASQAVRAHSVAAKNYSRDHRDLIFFLIDIDHFKQVNDEYGHDAGDRLLVAIAQRLDQVVRKSDFLIRWGGEEFLIVCRSAERLEAPRMAERILAAIGDSPFALGNDRTVSRTCSVGWVPFPWVPPFMAEASVEEALRLADRGLYLAKKKGRNQSIGILPGEGDLPGDGSRHLKLEMLEESGFLQEVRTPGPTVALAAGASV